MQNEKGDNEVNEPSAEYKTAGNKIRITFYKSLEEENDAQYQRWHDLTPEQRLEEHRILSCYVFGHYEKYTGNRLSFE